MAGQLEPEYAQKENPSLPLRPAWTALTLITDNNTRWRRGEYDEWGNLGGESPALGKVMRLRGVATRSQGTYVIITGTVIIIQDRKVYHRIDRAERGGSL